MKTSYILSWCLIACLYLRVGLAQDSFQYESSTDFPFGKLNPQAPQQVADFAPMIGQSNCDSQNRNPDGSWQEVVNMQWRFKYIMNGMAVQDESLKADGKHSGSIRQFNVDSLKWYVHYYATNSPTPVLSSWEGEVKADKIVLYRPQKAPNGMDGFSRLTFYGFAPSGFKWIGEWVNPDETIVYPFWKIDCKKSKANP